MTTDPFERLEQANPVPEDRLPNAPMSIAERIVARRTAGAPMPGWAIAAGAAVLVAVLGSAWLLLVNDGAPDSSAAAPTAAPDLPAEAEPPVATDGSALTTVPPPTTSPQTSDTTVPWTVGYDGEFPVYLFLDDNGTENAPGPYLIPTMRTTAILSAPITNIHATVAAFLVHGPTPGELDATPAMSTAIPAGTEVLGVEVLDRVATINLSEEFDDGGGTFSMRGRLAQIVFTLTAFEDIDGVRFEVDGVPTTVFGGEGVLVGDPATRAEFEDLLPAVLIESPPHWGRAGNPLVASGTANVFEATVSLALTDNEGLILWEGFTTATCGTGCRGEWEIEIPYRVDEAQLGGLIAWEESARDGSQTNVREHPVWLEPAGSTTATTAPSVAPDDPAVGDDADLWGRIQNLRSEVLALEKERRTVAEARALTTDQDAIREYSAHLADIDGMLHEQVRPQLIAAVDEARDLGWHWDLILNETCSGTMADPSLPDQLLEDNRPVISTWDDLHHAAVTCDWELLADYVQDGSNIRVTFGEPIHPLELWRYEEAIGYQPMYYLAEILRRPHTVTDMDTPNLTYVWPSAFIGEWDQVAEADRQALKPLYTEADLQEFAQWGGYFGYRVGIDGDTGEWVFFLQGD